MKAVFGMYSFDQPGGTESYVFTAAHELQRLGHEAIVVAEELGAMAEHAERWGIPVVSQAELPQTCDAVLAHDGIMCGLLAERYPKTRFVYFAHSDHYDHQLPIQLPGVVSVVIAASDRVAHRIQALSVQVPLVRLRHPIDTERFADAGPIRARPQRALMLSHSLDTERRERLASAWAEAGVECVQIGEPGRSELDVAPAIADADIVVAKGRAALEGMSCGRAVYVYDFAGGDGWVTRDNYRALEADNFAGLAMPGPCDPAAELGDYRADMGVINRELVRTHHSARRHAAQLVEVLRGAAPGSPGQAASAGEIGRLLRANWHAERHARVLKQEMVRLRRRTLAAEAEVEASRAAFEELLAARALLRTRRVRTGLALGRVLDRVRGRR